MMRNLILGLSFITTAACVDAEPGVAFDELEARPATDGKADTWAACAGMDPSFPSVEGLAGTYIRSFPYANGEISSVTLSAAPEGRGTYSGVAKRNGLLSAESGNFFAAPDNPALGAALAFDRLPLQSDGWFDEIYWVLASRRTFTGKVQALCIGKAGDANGNVENAVPFTLTRVGL